MKIYSRVFIFAMFLIASNAEAAYICTGKIEAINQAYDGSVSVASSVLYGNGQGRMVCTLNTTWKGVSPEVCKGWLAKLLSAEARASNITIQYNDSNSSCSNQPAWDQASNPWAMW